MCRLLLGCGGRVWSWVYTLTLHTGQGVLHACIYMGTRVSVREAVCVYTILDWVCVGKT